MDDTLRFYDINSDNYSEKTFSADLLEIYDRFTQRLPGKAAILDLGCGSGRDSKKFSEMGYTVTPVDGSVNMCQVAENNTGLKVRRLLFSELDYIGEFDAVWACSSLLHVPSGELPGIFRLIHDSLRKNGIFFCCFKKGTFEGIRDGRHYTDMTEDALSDMLLGCRFEALEIWESLQDGTGTAWVNSVSRKITA